MRFAAPLRPSLPSLALALALAAPARAYEQRLHELMTEAAPLAGAGDVLDPPDDAELDAFRAGLWQAFSTVPDAARRSRFLALFPTAGAFTSDRLKLLLMLNPDRRVRGLDFGGDALPRGQLLRLASRLPDDDARNQDRFWKDGAGEVRRGSDGHPLPADPAIGEMGGVTGISSQAHAHDQLLPVSDRSDAPDVLRSDPRHFSTPREAHTFGADFAAIYDDLATLAAHSGLPHAPALATLFRGYAFHHVEDACDQIHTVQVGLYDFFVDAQLEGWKQELRTVGGLLGPRVTLREAGVRILANHHLFSEDFYALQLLRSMAGEPSLPVGDVLARMAAADAPRFAEAVAARPEKPYARAALLAVVETGSLDAAPMYALARAFAAPDLSQWNGRDYAGTRTAVELHARRIAGDPALEAAWARFAVLQADGFARWGAIARAWPAAAAADPHEAAGRLVALLLDRDAEISARRSTWVAAPPRDRGLNKGLLTGIAILAALAVLAARSVVRRRQVLPDPPGPD